MAENQASRGIYLPSGEPVYDRSTVLRLLRYRQCDGR